MLENYITSDFSAIDNTLMGKIDMSEVTINEKLLFNTKLLEDCKIYSPRIDNSLRGYGTLVENELQLIDMRQIHPAGKEIKNNKTGKILPRGFQVRSDITIDTVNRDAILYDILEREWNTYARQIILFLLPEEYRYWKDGVEVIYGILDGNHRYDASDSAHEENLIAWLVDIPLNKIRKYGNAEANRQINSSKPRSNQDIADTIKEDMEDDTTELYENIKQAENDDNLNVIDIITKEIEDYHVHPKTVPSIRRIVIHETNVCVERKDYDSKRRELFVLEYCPDLYKVKGKEWDYETSEGVRVILIEASGSNHVIVANKICKMQNDKAPICVMFSNAKGDKVTIKNRDALRKKFMIDVFNTIKMMGKGYDTMFVKKNGVNPIFECLPELSDELETNELIRVI